MQHFSSDGVDIAYRDEGAGDPILLIHGFASNSAVNWRSTSWTDTLAKAGRRTIAMDVRGHGESAKLHEPAAYRLAVMAGDAANLIDHLKLGRADVMGYSMGGRIATVLALEHPGKVRSLIIGGMGTGMVEGIGGEDEIVAALEADSLSAVDLRRRTGLPQVRRAHQERPRRAGGVHAGPARAGAPRAARRT